MRSQGNTDGIFRQLSEPVKVTLNSMRYEETSLSLGTSIPDEPTSSESSRGSTTSPLTKQSYWTSQASDPAKVSLTFGAPSCGLSNAVPPLGKAPRMPLSAEQHEADTELPSPSSGRSSSTSLADLVGHGGISVAALCADLPPAPGSMELPIPPINPFHVGGAELTANTAAPSLGMDTMFGDYTEGTDDSIVSTALAVRNLPKFCVRGGLIEEMNQAAFRENRDYNLFVMPVDPCLGTNMGYCLVNFVNVSVRNAFVSAFHGRFLECTGTEVEVVPATLQDLKTTYCQVIGLMESSPQPVFRPSMGPPQFCSQCGHGYGLQAVFFCSNCGSTIPSRR